MRVMQRVVMLIILLYLFVLGFFFMNLKEKRKLIGQWEVLHTERFLQKLSRTRQCSLEELKLYDRTLEIIDDEIEIRLEEFQKETDESGRRYYYMISWEEIKEQLLSEEVYLFREESILVITVIRKSKSRSTANKYSDIVGGKD